MLMNDWLPGGTRARQRWLAPEGFPASIGKTNRAWNSSWNSSSILSAGFRPILTRLHLQKQTAGSAGRLAESSPDPPQEEVT